MRTWSTEESVAKNEPTIMALAEALLALAISVGIAIRYETLTHIAFGACIAPLLLMRSEKSVALGVRWFNHIKPKKPAKDDLLSRGWRYLRILISSVVIKTAATASHPIKGVQNIPTNWLRVVFCTDLKTSVELVPGLGPARETLKNSTTNERQSGFAYLLGSLMGGIVFSSAIHYWIEPWIDSNYWKIPWQMLSLAFLSSTVVVALGLACYFVAYLYRLSLKSTAIIWLPLVYIVHATFDQTIRLPVQLGEMRRSALWKLIRFLSWLTLALLAWKIFVLPNVIELWNSQSWTKVLNVYVMPNEIHPWHVATGLNSAIALIGFYYFLDRAPRRLREGIWNESTVLHGVQIFTFIRGAISIYTIFVGLLLTVRAAQFMHWPTWSGKLVPW